MTERIYLVFLLSVQAALAIEKGVRASERHRFLGYARNCRCQLNRVAPPPNELSGEITPELGSLANLSVPDISDNQLSGCLPSSLKGQMSTMTDLGGLPYC